MADRKHYEKRPAAGGVRVLDKNASLEQDRMTMACWWSPRNGRPSPESRERLGSAKAWWRCVNGHEMLMCLAQMAGMKWRCPVCGSGAGGGEASVENMPIALRRMFHNASPDADMSGVSIYDSSPRMWVCDNGHEVYASPDDMRSHSDCPVCEAMHENHMGAFIPPLNEAWHRGGNKGTPRKGTLGRFLWGCPRGHLYEDSYASVMTRFEYAYSQLLPLDAEVVCLVCRKMDGWPNYGSEYEADMTRRLAGILESEPGMPEDRRILFDCRTVLDSKREIDAYIPSLRLGFEWDAGPGHRTPEGMRRAEEKDREAARQGIHIVHVDPTKYRRGDNPNMPLQLANIRRSVRAAIRRFGKRQDAERMKREEAMRRRAAGAERMRHLEEDRRVRAGRGDAQDQAADRRSGTGDAITVAPSPETAQEQVQGQARTRIAGTPTRRRADDRVVRASAAPAMPPTSRRPHRSVVRPAGAPDHIPTLEDRIEALTGAASGGAGQEAAKPEATNPASTRGDKGNPEPDRRRGTEGHAPAAAHAAGDDARRATDAASANITGNGSNHAADTGGEKRRRPRRRKPTAQTATDQRERTAAAAVGQAEQPGRVDGDDGRNGQAYTDEPADRPRRRNRRRPIDERREPAAGGRPGDGADRRTEVPVDGGATGGTAGVDAPSPDGGAQTAKRRRRRTATDGNGNRRRDPEQGGRRGQPDGRRVDDAQDAARPRSTDDEDADHRRRLELRRTAATRKSDRGKRPSQVRSEYPMFIEPAVIA